MSEAKLSNTTNPLAAQTQIESRFGCLGDPDVKGGGEGICGVEDFVPTFDTEADWELLQLCDRFNVLERHIRALWLENDGNVWTKLASEQQEIVGRIEDLPPKTLPGFQAVARAVIGWWPAMPEDQIGDLNDVDAHLMTFLLRNLVQMPQLLSVHTGCAGYGSAA